MKKIDSSARYFETNEWARVRDQFFEIGITDFAQTVFGDINFVELPEVGATIEKGKPFAVIESNKAANDVSAPLSGTVIAINKSIVQHPELLNTAPYEKGWLIMLEATKSAEWNDLMSAEAYRRFMSDFFYKT